MDMKKGVEVFCVVLLIAFILSISFASANVFTDFFNKVFGKKIYFSPPVPTSSYTCYTSGAPITCIAGQYCVAGVCSSSAPPSYVNSYGCYSPTGALLSCTNSQLCYNGACK